MEKHVTYVGLRGRLTSRLGRCESQRWYDLFTAEFAAELATILLVGVILKLVSRWKGLERDEFDRHFLAGIGSLLSAILLLIVAKTGTM